MDISRLMRPRSIAIVGISPEPTSAGFHALKNLETFGYAGDIHLVSRNRTEIGGRACVRSIDELPRGVDAAMLLVPRNAIEEAVQACARREVGGVVVFASGFAEAGGEWAKAQDRIAQAARTAGIALCGPNCLGIVDYARGVALTFGAQAATQGAGIACGAAVIAQSGGLAGVIRTALAAKGIPVTCTVSTGNEAVLGLEDYAAFLLEDPTTTAVVAFAEQIRRPGRFLAMAARARELGKPVVLLITGRSEAGRESARSHTGALAGDHGLIETQLRHACVMLPRGLEELIDVTELAYRFPQAPTRGLAMVTDSGAVKGITLDFCEEVGLDLPPLSPRLEAVIQAQLPEFVGASNPVDLTAQAIIRPEMYGNTIGPMLADAAFGSLVLAVIISEVPESGLAKAKRCLDSVRGSTKPALIALLGDEANIPPSIVTDSRAAGIPFFRSPERALAALASYTRYGRSVEKARMRTLPQPLEAPPLPGRGTLTEHACKAWLGGLGLPVPRGGLARDLAQAKALAAAVGFPVAMKLQAAALAHKSDAGAVLLGIGDTEQLVSAWERLQGVGRDLPGLDVDGVLVEAMAPPGLEMIVGARRDPDWGPVAVVGLGGIWTEALKDVRILPVALETAEIAEEIGRLKAARLLAGMRGMPARDVAALARIVQRIGLVMASRPEIAEIDVNPLVVDAHGDGVLALDALIVSA
ncbi:MAG: acetate--CoA ligase family protein [Burkholderiales bacterium]|nr:acetate--CoA ligase family protein [Burkholderiales bacterium]